MYHARALHGGTPDLWEENWEHNDFETALQFCESDPLLPLFQRYATPGSTMLEGGCGQGQYVAYYSARNVKVVGLDFAQQTLQRLRDRVPNLKLCAGDVAALPFPDDTFDLYYSGGVVEHFEGGPERAIAEARRVLKTGGVLLISVPYLNLLRRGLSPFRAKVWKRVKDAAIDVREDSKFFQYIYSTREFEAMLRQAGLRVIATQGYGILWGLYDVSFLEKLAARIGGNGTGSPAASSAVQTNGESNSTATPGNGRPTTVRGLLKRLAVNEDDTVPIAGLGVRLMRVVCANMMMYVCRRSDP